MKSSKRLFWFSLVPLLCFLPTTIINMVSMFTDSTRAEPTKIFDAVSFRLWGFINVLVYWFSRPDNDESYSFISSATSLRPKRLGSGTSVGNNGSP